MVSVVFGVKIFSIAHIFKSAAQRYDFFIPLIVACRQQLWAEIPPLRYFWWRSGFFVFSTLGLHGGGICALVHPSTAYGKFALYQPTKITTKKQNSFF
jgi:hypothetical protein